MSTWDSRTKEKIGISATSLAWAPNTRLRELLGHGSLAKAMKVSSGRPLNQHQDTHGLAVATTSWRSLYLVGPKAHAMPPRAIHALMRPILSQHQHSKVAPLSHFDPRRQSPGWISSGLCAACSFHGGNRNVFERRRNIPSDVRPCAYDTPNVWPDLVLYTLQNTDGRPRFYQGSPMLSKSMSASGKGPITGDGVDRLAALIQGQQSISLRNKTTERSSPLRAASLMLGSVQHPIDGRLLNVGALKQAQPDLHRKMGGPPRRSAAAKRARLAPPRADT